MDELLQKLIGKEIFYLEIEAGEVIPVCCEQGTNNKINILRTKQNYNKTGEIAELLVPSEGITIEKNSIYFLENGLTNIQAKRYLPSDPEYKEKYLALEEVGLI